MRSALRSLALCIALWLPGAAAHAQYLVAPTAPTSPCDNSNKVANTAWVTICGGGGGGAVSSVSGTTGQITVSPTTGDAVVGLPGTLTPSETATGTWNFTGPFQIGGTGQNFPPSGHLVGTTDTQTLSAKSIDASEINSGVFDPARLPASGVTAGTYALPSLTIDSAGRITSATPGPTLGSMATQNASAVAITGGTIAVSADPVSALQVATKEYVDATATQISRLSPVAAATAAILPNSPTYSNGTLGVGATLTGSSNGALTTDGYAVQLNDRVLVQDQASAFQNGIFTETQVGTGSVPFILTRSTDFDQASEMLTGTTVFVLNGSVNIAATFTMNTTGTITVGTTPINWVQTGGAGGTGNISGPPSSTVGFIPQWGNIAGTQLAQGLPVGTTGNSTILETNPTGLIDTSILPLIAVTNGGTGLVAGASGGVLAFTASTTLASSAALAAGHLVLGGGAGSVPTSDADWSIASERLFGTNNAAVTSPPASTLLSMVAADATSDGAQVYTFGAGGNAQFSGFRADGTGASKSGVIDQDVLVGLYGGGYDGTAYSASGTGVVQIRAAETWSGMAHGTKDTFWVTPNGSTALAQAAALEPDGTLFVGSDTSSTSHDTGSGTVNAATGYFVNGSALAIGNLAAIPAHTLIGNPTASSAAPTTITLGSNLSFSGSTLNATGGGSSVTWPPSSQLLVSNGTNAPAGIPPVNGDCVIGSSGSWVAGSCAGTGSWVPPASIDATTQSGADLCAKISNAQNTLAAINGTHGGIIYALSFSSPSHCTNSAFNGWTSDRNYELVLGQGIIQTDQPFVVPTFDSFIGTTEYNNFASSAGTVIQPSTSYATSAGVTHAVTGSSGSTTLSLTSTSGIVDGDAVTGTNIAPHALVASHVTNSSVTLTEPNTGTVSTTATFMPAVVSMGQPDQNDFHIHVENIAATCVPTSGTMPSGCIVFQDLWSQEGSYFRNTYAGIGEAQYDIESLQGEPENPENIAPWMDLYAQALATTTGLDLANANCGRFGNSTALLQIQGTIDKMSCSGSSTTTKALITITGVSGLTLNDTHMESAMGGILIGATRNTHGITLMNNSCGPGLATAAGQSCVELSNGAGSDGVSIFGLSAPNSTNFLKDDQSGGCTINSGSTGSSFTGVTYIRGGNGTKPVITGLYSGC